MTRRASASVSGIPSEHLRVAHVLPAGVDPLSGVATAVTHLAAALARRGHAVELWMLHRFTSLDREVYDPVVDGSGVSWVPMSQPVLRHVGQLRGRPVDLVHLHSVFSPRNALLATRLQRSYVLSPHGGYSPAALERGRGRKRLYSLAVERRLVRRAAACVALTPLEAQDLGSFSRPRLTEVVPNGVARPAAGRPPGTLRADLGLHQEQRLAVFVGRLDVHHKGLDRLVRALAVAPEWNVALAGGEARDGAETLRRLARDEGVGRRLHLLGPRTGSGLEDVFAAADLYVLASRWEGLPMSLLEALARGVPALVTSEVEAVVGVAEAGAGWAAPAVALGTELRRLAQLDDAAWAAAGTAARTLASSFSWERAAEAHELLYASLVRGNLCLPPTSTRSDGRVGHGIAHRARGDR